jgi:hypothetical protein
MSKRSWIRDLFACRPTRSVRKAPACARLGLEALEERTVPSTFTVLNTLDDGSVGSLRWAVAQANSNRGDDKIDFSPTVFNTRQTITLTGGQLELSDTTGVTSIVGSAAGVTISGGGQSRVLLVDPSATAALTDLTISNGYVYQDSGGGVYNSGTLTLTGCTLSGNSADGPPDDGRYRGGAVLNADAGTLTMTNCTVSGNAARNGGGLENLNMLTMTNCTVSGNSATYRGGGIENNATTLFLTNTIVSGNAGAFDIAGVSGSNNYFQFGDVVSGNAMLAPLGDYGGPTQTMPLLPGSPAIDRGITGTGIPTTDQRGLARVGMTDSGAFESQGFTLTRVAGSNPQTAVIGTRFSNPLAVTLSANNPIEPVNGAVVNFTANPVNGATAILSASSTAIADGRYAVLAMPNNAAGSYTVTAAATGVVSISFTLTNDGPVLPNLVVSSTSGSLFPAAGLSLPAAIAIANTETTKSTNIIFDQTVFATPQTITLTGTALELSDSTMPVTITGSAAGVTISGGGLSRVFQVDQGVRASITGLTISNGNAFPGESNLNDVGSGGGVLNSGTLTLTGCTLIGNSANAGGGALFNGGTVAVVNCTVSGNADTRGGGGGIQNGGTATVTNCTISGNTSGLAGGGLSNSDLFRGTLTVKNTIVSGNWSFFNPKDLDGAFSGTNNLIGGNAMLAPLGDYGGPTHTMVPLAGSPALGAGDNTGGPATDQRGFARSTGAGGTIGAVEGVGFTVTNINDSGAGSLRQAVLDANRTASADVILFSSLFNSPQTITLTGGELDLTDAATTTIAGPGAKLLTVSGNQTSRVFAVTSGAAARLEGLTITGGNTAGDGGGLNSVGGTVTLTNCAVSGNSATGSGNGGGVQSDGNSTLTMIDCTLSGNSAGGDDGGGGLATFGKATLTNVTVSGNSARSGGGVTLFGTAKLTNVTVSGNSASVRGGGVDNSGTAALSNTIIAGNTGPSSPDVFGVFNSQGNDLIGKTDGSSGWVGSDLTGTIAAPLDPLLAPLGDYGGPTQTMALLPGSTAIDAGAATGAPSTDQRGSGRVGTVDVGAFESGGFTIAVTSGSGQEALGNTTFSAPLVVQVAATNLSEPVAGGLVTITPPTSGASATLSEDPAIIQADGTASVTATANSTLGGYTLAATARGVAAGASFSLTNVQPAQTTTAVTSPADQPVYGDSVTFTATVTSTATPTGSVNFVIDGGTPVAGTVASTTGSTATWTYTTSTLTAGPHTVAADFVGGGIFTNSEGTLSGGQMVGKAPSTVVVAINGGPFTYTGLAQTPATVTVTGAGGLSLTPAANYANNVGAGTATASYTFAGDANHEGSTASQDFTIGKADATVTVNGYSGTADGAPHGATGSVVGVAGDPSAAGSRLDLGASFTAAPGGTATWSFDGGANYNGQSGSVAIALAAATPAPGGTATPGDAGVTPQNLNPAEGDLTAAFAGLTPQERFVQALYLDDLGRAGRRDELDYWVGVLNGPRRLAGGGRHRDRDFFGRPRPTGALLVSHVPGPAGYRRRGNELGQSAARGPVGRGGARRLPRQPGVLQPRPEPDRNRQRRRALRAVAVPGRARPHGRRLGGGLLAGPAAAARCRGRGPGVPAQ